MESDEEAVKYHRLGLDPKRCFVPDCGNTTFKTPEKQFFSVPKSKKFDWYRAVGLQNVPTRYVHICDDHLNLEQDVENYKAWKSNKVRPKLKGRIPTSLENFSPTINMGSPSLRTTKQLYRSISIEVKPEVTSKHIQAKEKMTDKSIQCSIWQLKNKLTTTTDFEEDILCDDNEVIPSISGSTISEMTEVDSTSESGSIKPLVGRSFLVDLIIKKPFMYIGIPKNYVWLKDYLATECNNISTLDIIMTLYKIKNNDSFPKMADQFQISSTTQWRSFFKTLQVLSTFFKQFIFWPATKEIKKNLPTAFRTNKYYANVHSIIDCFEIEIQKPSNPIERAKTWSQYRNCNTLKYLISSTPDGFINFISPGYGGRISDVKLVETCGFLEIIPPGCTILVDRGFKHLEPILSQKYVKLLRPPSVSTGSKLSKDEVVETKVIASFRIRVIRRLREFKFLEPHAVIHNKLINCTDEVVQVVCGLINIQSPIIKTF